MDTAHASASALAPARAPAHDLTPSRASRTPTRPAAGDVHVWFVRPPRSGSVPRSPGADAGTAADSGFTAPDSGLSVAELRRAASFARAGDGDVYATAHAALRRLLGGYLGRPPAGLTFVRKPCPGCSGPHGRPAVVQTDDAPTLHFSLAHSRGLIAVAVAPRVIGVDVERLPSTGTVEACARALHTRERAELAAVPPEERQAYFGRLWTRKEAYLKALGTGLSRHPRIDYLGADLRRRPARWAVLDLPAGPEHTAAVAVDGARPDRVTVRWLPAHRHGDGPAAPDAAYGSTTDRSPR
ncbi:4'-phosphopantetheinyl transferase [Streptomyces cavourensis]|uniref:4'-phosphopantetheinyl transferase superfamily protein n=1 Tax=Streptomyces cavourensis TaxID=67258 RepID=A0ABY5F0G1_9ACTN|nr:4'-phosphopantetheinyl transferase superfamily protein [Streptomyces cavourensis]TQO31789.1 4'-phosphopantetheinyl transferase [Streptomyces cavourensis]UTR77319.1 4'-phosphopantetheinyl transferase superfamily protein [Streptomyces cavourensis]GGU94539.1 4'-phosphopantetheinyl transferase [Streptomyces cavourensis]